MGWGGHDRKTKGGAASDTFYVFPLQPAPGVG